MKKLVFLFLSLVACTGLFAQEICNNGKDDDGNGFIDCYDKACAVSTFCKDFYLGEDPECEVVPPAFPQFTMALDFASPDETTNHLGRMAIGDLNRDGTPEIVSMNRYTKRLFILNGSDGSIQKQATVSFEPNWEIAIANIDNDNCGEIFFFGYEDPPGDPTAGYYLYAYDCDLNFIWRSDTKLRGDPINYGIADFDGNGKAELYVKDAVYDAHTGRRLIKSTGSDWSRINGGPVAVDMDDDEDLELVLGCAIYDVNLGDGTQDNGSLTLIKKVDSYYIRNEYNATSVADFNQDGHLDVLASGSTGSHGANTTIFFWDVANDTIKTYSDPIPGSFTIYACPTQTGEYYKNGWKNGTGRINIADLDGNGKLDISYVSGKYLYALNDKLEPLPWSPKLVNEETSGHTGCTLFDFNGDGKSEIVYRDERYLYIINGTDGSIYNQQTCVSRTNREYPIVADVDADGSTELCVTCGFDDQAALNNFCNLNYSRYSHVRVFKSADDPWVPARRVWNQHGYFNVNVNNDLTIPIRQQKHHLVFSSGSCTTGENRPLNGFLNQAPFLNIDGCPTYRSPDLSFVENSLQVQPPTCPATTFQISFQFRNEGDIALSGNLPISFYNGNPNAPGAVRLNTVEIPLANLQVDGVFPVTNINVNGPGGNFTLYIVLNDNGTTPVPITLPNTDFRECDYSDNILSSPIAPIPVALTAVTDNDNTKCAGVTSPDNGVARAFVLTNGVENISDYTFYWSEGNAKPVPADHTGSTVNGLAEGTYSVYAIHKTAQCSSDTTQTTVELTTNSISAKAVLLQNNTNCVTPNGRAIAIVNDTDNDGVGDSPDDFTFTWYEGNNIFTDPQIANSQTATGLEPLTYSVVVTDRFTGCIDVTSITILNEAEKPVVSASADDISCSSSADGAVHASATNAGADVTFKWYKGSALKPMHDFIGADYENIPGGSYTVTVTDNTSGCVSEPETITVEQSDPVNVSVTGIAHQTSCDPTKPNGAASANVNGQTSGFTFDWFSGQNTLQSNFISSGNDIQNLKPGVYTVRATDNATGCTDTEELTIDFAVETPELIMGTVGGMVNCTTPDGSITVTVSMDTPADYDYFWYNGTTTTGASHYPSNNDNVLENLPIGVYSVRAVHKTKFCETEPVSAEVEDNTPTIEITQTQNIGKLPTNCNSTDGELGVDVTAPGNTLGFFIEWTKDNSNTPFTSDNNAVSSVRSGLSSGVYTISATNLNNGCTASKEFPLPFATAQFLTLISKDDVITCTPNNEGNIVLELTATSAEIPGTPPVTFSPADYRLDFHAGNSSAGTLIENRAGNTGTPTGALTANFTFSNLTPGFYTAVAYETNPLLGGCPSIPLTIEIIQNTTTPVLSQTTINSDVNCPAALSTGSIELDVDGAQPNSNYTFEWFEGSDATAPVLGTHTSGTAPGVGDVASNLPGGDYFVRVTNNTNGCFVTKGFRLYNNPPTLTLTDADVEKVDITMCNALNAGSAVVNVVRENGSAANIADYDFQWFDADQNILPSTTNSINNLSAGEYFVKVTKSSGSIGAGCSSELYALTIDDTTIGSVAVSVDNFTEPTRCLQPSNLLGSITVIASGTSANGYTYEWFAGNTATGGTVSNTPTISNINIPFTDNSTFRTVRVTNNTNLCSVVETFEVPLLIAPVTMTASASPNTSCVSPNGSVFATVTSGSSNNYTYQWYNGTSVAGTPASLGKSYINRTPDSYTVIAIDNNDNFCQSPVMTVVVDEAKKNPVVTAQALSPVTVCDPLKVNGTASASVNGDVIHYRFDWFDNVPPSGSPFHSGPDYGQFASGQYAVVATNLVSGCSDMTTVTINEAIVTIPLPQVQVLSNDISCISENGVLTASVNGNTQDFIFHWFDTNPGNPADTTSADLKGESYSNLSAGSYYVTATSRITGCTSAAAPGVIIEDLFYPDFDFKIEPSTCEQDNGFISVSLKQTFDIETIVWTFNGNSVIGPNLESIPAGFYSVTVTTNQGCATTKDVEVKPDVRPFNGVSRQKDGQNDFFLINCIENYPDNIVKIFNRAGTLVFEAEGYDNIETYFDGKSNKGIAMLGNNLPDGTYFYIIDKRDGSKPVAGYLEVVN